MWNTISLFSAVLCSFTMVHAAQGCEGKTFGANCTYTCHCKNGAVCNATTGYCPGGECSTGWEGDYCHLGNTAVGKNAQQSSNYSSRSLPAGKAVDGNLGQSYDRCTHTRSNTDQPWWMVDLAMKNAVFGVTLYNRKKDGCARSVECRTRLKNFKIWVSDEDSNPNPDSPGAQLCVYHQPVIGLGEIKRLTCGKPVVGRYLYIRLMSNKTALTLCEVVLVAYQYRECPSGRYGPNCNKRCQCDKGVECDDVGGACPAGCNQQFTGPYCNIEIPSVRLGAAYEASMQVVTWPAASVPHIVPKPGQVSAYRLQYTPVEGPLKWTNAGEGSLVGTSYQAKLQNLSVNAAYTFRLMLQYKLNGPGTWSKGGPESTYRIFARAQDSGCGSRKNQTGTSGSFSSRNYPSNYNNGAKCTWVITVPLRNRIRIHFKSPFELETHSTCGYDAVSIYEELPQQGLIGSYCNKPSDKVSKDNDLVVKFRSDGSNTGDGFSLEWTAIPPQVSGCGTSYKLSGTNGSIASMNYPKSYANGADCSWIISVPAGMRLSIKFAETFEIEPGPEDSCVFDNVELRRVDSNGYWGKSYGIYCGFSVPKGHLVSEGNTIGVIFRSDFSANYSGFSLEWQAIYACGLLDNPTNGTVSMSDEDKVNSKATYSCDDGFKLLGYNRQCQKSGKWSGDPPTCEEIRCSRPDAPSGSSISLSDNGSIGSKVTYTCDSGYKLNGQRDRSCLLTGMWSGQAPSCQDIRCGLPDLPASGGVHLSDLDRVDSNASYSCSLGFQLIGGKQRRCLASGQWSGETPICQEIHCGPADAPRNGSVSLSDSDRLDSNATYSCDDGLRLVGNSTRRCQADGSWSGATPRCKEMGCSPPDMPLNGSVSLSDDDHINSTATYSCEDGFQIIGNATRQCLKSGLWSEKVPVCQEIRCGSPDIPRNGSVLLSDSDRIGSKATYSCVHGFKRSSNVTRRCLVSGEWSDETPTCQGANLNCTSSDPPSNGSVSISGGAATYTCADGFDIIGDTDRWCLESGTWSGEDPSCQAIRCGHPLVPESGNVSVPDDAVNSTATYACNKGFKLVGKTDRLCLATGNWSGALPNCQEIRCGHLNTPAKGKVTLTDADRSGSKATYTCDDGYKLAGTRERQCMETGDWSGEAPECQEIRCGLLGAISNGSVSVSDDRLGSVATYLCNDGFKLIGATEIKCLETGEWSRERPTCQAIHCGPLQITDGSSSLTKEDVFGSKATFSCNDGYHMIGTPERECLETGHWSGDSPSCKEIHCGLQGSLTDGSMTFTNEDRIGSKATYTCNEGFKLIGPKELQCLRSGKWSGDLPSCQEIRCGPLTDIADGRITLSSADRIGSKATYSCNDGYKLLGQSERWCQKGGNWTGGIPVCQEIHCGPLDAPANGTVFVSDEDRVTSKARYACDDGFSINGDSERHCTKTGAWTGAAPTCDEILCGSLDQPVGGRVSLSNEDRWNSKATYVCSVGFRLVGMEGRRCLWTGSWSGTAPVCQEIRCGHLRVPTGCRISLSDSVRIGSKATYSCQGGTSTERTVRQCLNTGEWSGEAVEGQSGDGASPNPHPEKQNAGRPESWVDKSYVNAYLAIGILFNVVLLILVLIGGIYGLFRLNRRIRLRLLSGGSDRSSFKFDNPAFQGNDDRDAQSYI